MGKQQAHSKRLSDCGGPGDAGMLPPDSKRLSERLGSFNPAARAECLRLVVGIPGRLRGVALARILG